jgi:hypothetical protein
MKQILFSLMVIPFAVAIVLAWVITISARARHAFAMINQDLSVTPTKTRQVFFPATVVTAGTPLMLGNGAERSPLPMVNLDSYQQTIGGATCYFDGAYFFSVVAASSISPFVGLQVNPGDPIYALGGTLDATTNVLSGFTLCADSAGYFFGRLNSQSQPITAGVTATASVEISL